MKTSKRKSRILFLLKEYLKENDGVDMYKIHKIEIRLRSITIYLEYPGLFIGRGGKQIDEIEKKLDTKIKVVEFDPFYIQY